MGHDIWHEFRVGLILNKRARKTPDHYGLFAYGHGKATVMQVKNKYYEQLQDI